MIQALIGLSITLFILLGINNLAFAITEPKDMKYYKQKYKEELIKEFNLQLKDVKKYVPDLSETSLSNGWSTTFLFTDLISKKKYYKFSVLENQSGSMLFGGMTSYNGVRYVIFDNKLNIVDIKIFIGNLNKKRLELDEKNYLGELSIDTVDFLKEIMNIKGNRDVFLYCDENYKNYRIGRWEEHCFKPQEKIKYSIEENEI